MLLNINYLTFWENKMVISFKKELESLNLKSQKNRKECQSSFRQLILQVLARIVFNETDSLELEKILAIIELLEIYEITIQDMKNEFKKSLEELNS